MARMAITPMAKRWKMSGMGLLAPLGTADVGRHFPCIGARQTYRLQCAVGIGEGLQSSGGHLAPRSERRDRRAT